MAKLIFLQILALTIVLASSFHSTKAQSPFIKCAKNDPKHSPLTNMIDKALTQLTSMASTSYFNTSTSGHQDQVYGLFSCRYDASLKECHSCVAFAAASITDICPNSSDAIIYYPLNCTLHYANHSIFSYVEDQIKYTESRNELVNDNGQFRQVLINTVSSLISNVTLGFNSSSRYFGTTTAEYLSRSHKMIYALAQCNPDITPSNCSNCLQEDFNSYISLHSGQVPVGGQMFSPSCMLGFKLSSKVQNPPWNFLSTGARGSSLYGSYMASISIVVLSLMLLRM